MKTFKTLKILQSALFTTFTVTFLALSGCSSTPYKIDRQATVAAPWKVGEVIATTAAENKGAGGAAKQDTCLINGAKVACDFEREFLGINKKGQYVVQDFYTPETVQQYLKDAPDKRVKRTDPYLITKQTAAEARLFLPANIADISGCMTIWYLTGGKQLVIEAKNGLKHGLWTAWYENGQMDEQENYVDGKKEGLSTRWYDTGQLYIRFVYSNDNLNGRQDMWNANGSLSMTWHYVDGQEDGVAEMWDDDGQMVARNVYAMGRQHGKQEGWYADGRLHVVGYFTNGKKNAAADQWWWYGDGGKLNKEGRQVSEFEAKQLLHQYNDEKSKLQQTK